MPEAEIVPTPDGDVPRGEGWYVLNAQRARWQHSPGFGGSDLSFQGDVRFPEVGFHLGVLAPGEPPSMYRPEDTQEGCLVLSGRCLAIVEGRERILEPWDFLHCPGGTEHVLVRARDRGPRSAPSAARARPGASCPPWDPAAPTTEPSTSPTRSRPATARAS